jgi:mono/diheme cytochrome c family protein/glucose/arabinose dehydrogenase
MPAIRVLGAAFASKTMVMTRLRAILVLVALAAVTGSAYQSSPVNRPWPPGVQTVSNQSPPLSPEESLKTFFMPPGYRVELVASEPLVQEPVAMDWDLEGRLWVVEMPGWMPNIRAEGELDPIGRIVVLEDADGNGRMDKRTVFADRLVLARSLKILDRGVLVAEPPNVWLLKDTDGDLRMDAKELVTSAYGDRDVDPQNNANGFLWAVDNIMHTAGQSDIQLRLKNGRFEIQKTLRRGEWGVTQDDAGRIYRNTNESALHADHVPTFYYARNPNLLRTRGSYDRLADTNYALNVVWPVRPNPGTNRAYQAGIDRPDGTLVRFTSVCAPTVYRGDRLPSELRGNVFVAEPAANLVSRIVLEDDGTGMQAHKGYERGEFLASTDERFRPVYFSNAPDGTLYIADLYRGIIEHRISITTYLRDQILSRQLDEPTGMGRIYRVMHETTARDETRSLASASLPQLVETLSHPNGWRRDAAQRLLIERGAKSMSSALIRLAEEAKDWRTRLHALWTLDGLDAVEARVVAGALEDPSRDVRAAAVRMAERWLSQPDHPIHAAVLKRLADEDWAVRRQLAASLGAMPAGPRESAIASLLEGHADDPVVMDAALSGVRGSEPVLLEKLLQPGSAATPQIEAAIAMTTATILRGGQDSTVQALFETTADETRTPWQRAALLRGAEIALLGAAMPARPVKPRSVPPESTAALPCPTCPGGRAGPGGAYAFPRPAGWPSGGRGGGPRLRLNREPLALTKLAAGSAELGGRATKVLERVSWPGKPGEPAPVAALTPGEQQRFNAGQEVYRNLCQACHQPDGRGQEKLAPSLVGSAMALAPPEVPARILLNGKEGTIGLMPPIGGTLSDEQLASVLTYVRREWGNTGTPVDPSAVTAVRVLTTGRTRPWTDAELMKLVPAGR